jgi:hypothetical protein
MNRGDDKRHPNPLPTADPPAFPKEDHIARFHASYSYYPDDFGGLGNHSPFSAKTGFSQKQYFINPRFLKRIHGNVYLGVTYEYQHTGPVSYPEGSVFDHENTTGRHGGNTSGIGPILSWDTQNNAYSPDRGGFELNGLHYIGGGGLRFALSKEEKLNLRVDYGVAKHSNAFTVQLREAF